MSGASQTGFTSRLRRWIQITTLAYKSWAAILGSVLGCIALCNLLFRLFDVSISEGLHWLLVAYQQTFHPPIAFIFSWLPFALPPAAKDVILLYLAIGGVLFRSITYEQPSELRRALPHSWRDIARRIGMRASYLVAALLWPKVLRTFLTKPCLLVTGEQGFHGRLPYMSRQDAASFLSKMPGNPTVFCDERELIFSYFISLVMAVFALVTLNAAVNELTAKLS